MVAEVTLYFTYQLLLRITVKLFSELAGVENFLFPNFIPASLVTKSISSTGDDCKVQIFELLGVLIFFKRSRGHVFFSIIQNFLFTKCVCSGKL